MIRAFWSMVSIADLILIVFVIMTIGFAYSIQHKDMDNKQIHVYKNNELIKVLDLNSDTDFVIDEHNSIRIKDGKVSMMKSDCPDQLCVKQGSTDKIPVICVPNKIIIEIKDGGKETPRHILH